MGTLADSLFTVLMSWVRALVSALWSLVSSDDMTVLEFIGRNWLMIAVVIIAAGLVLDWVIWLLRWQPYHLWAQRVRRLLRIEEPEEEEEKLRARPAVTKKRAPVYEAPVSPAREVPLYVQEEESEMLSRADDVPDSELGAYPGRRYDREHPGMTADRGTQRFSVLSGEGPGAAEVARRREEIDEYRRMQEEAAQRAREEAEKRAQEERAAREAAERRAQEEAAWQAQAQYERELEEYERQRAQYERDLAEYERQKAAYDAQMAAQTAAQETIVIPAVQSSRRRRAQQTALSGHAGDETGAQEEAPQAETEKKPGLLDRVADIIGPQEEEEITGIRALPPRVDMHEAYKPAKTPQKDGRRRR